VQAIPLIATHFAVAWSVCLSFVTVKMGSRFAAQLMAPVLWFKKVSWAKSCNFQTDDANFRHNFDRQLQIFYRGDYRCSKFSLIMFLNFPTNAAFWTTIFQQ